jgi:hypothetical protein
MSESNAEQKIEPAKEGEREPKRQKNGGNWGALKKRGHETPLGEAGLSEKGTSNSS